MSFLKSRWFTVGIGAAIAVVSQIKPAWGVPLAAAAGFFGWAVPHPADKK